MFRGWTCDTWLGKPLGGTLGKWIMVVIFQIGHSHNRVQKILQNQLEPYLKLNLYYVQVCKISLS